MQASDPKKADDEYSEREAQERFEKLVKSALNTRPKQQKDMLKGMPSQSKKRLKKAKKSAA